MHKRLQLWEQSPNCQVPIVIISYVRLFLIKFYRRHSELVEKYNVSLRKLLQQGISEPEFYGDLVYRIRKIVGKSNFSEQFRKLINRYKRIGYNPYVMRQTACQPRLIAVLHSLIARWRVGPRLNDGLDIKISQVVGA